MKVIWFCRLRTPSQKMMALLPLMLDLESNMTMLVAHWKAALDTTLRWFALSLSLSLCCMCWSVNAINLLKLENIIYEITWLIEKWSCFCVLLGGVNVWVQTIYRTHSFCKKQKKYVLSIWFNYFVVSFYGLPVPPGKKKKKTLRLLFHVDGTNPL